MHLFHTCFQTADVFICKIIQEQHVGDGLLVFLRFGAPLMLREAGLCVGSTVSASLVQRESREARKGWGPLRDVRAEAPRQAAWVALAGVASPGPASGRRGHAPAAGSTLLKTTPRSHTRPGGPVAGSWGARSPSFWKLTARLPGFVATTTITWAQTVVLYASKSLR